MSIQYEDFVKEFGKLMAHELWVNQRKDIGHDGAGWKDCSFDDLLDKLDEEVRKLREAIQQGKPSEVIGKEAADVGNLAMMLANNVGAIWLP